MQKILCNRCGKEIIYNPQQQAILPTYNINYVIHSFYEPETFDLCNNCQIEFNSLMERWLNEERNSQT